MTTAADTRDLILSTALKMAGRHGLEGLTIGELAKAVGMSKSGLFAHFGGKDRLQLSVMQTATAVFVDEVLRAALKAPRGEPRVRAIFEKWLAHLDDDGGKPGGNLLIAASLELDDRPGVLRDYVQQVQRDLIGNLEKAAQFAIDEGHFRKDLNVELFAWSLYSFVLGYHHFKRMLEDPKAKLHLQQSFRELIAISRAENFKHPQSKTPEGEKSQSKATRGPTKVAQNAQKKSLAASARRAKANTQGTKRRKINKQKTRLTS